MKKYSLLLVAFGLSTAASAADFASSTPTLSGYGELFAGKFIAGAGVEMDTLIGATASANANFDARWNIQTDITYDALNFASSKVSGIGSALHIYWRDPQTFAIGSFATISKARWATSGTRINAANQWTAGVESQAYLGDITLYGQAWMGKTQTFSNPAMNQIGVRSIARYHVNDNLRLDGELAYVASRRDGVRDTNAAAAAQINYRFASLPATLFGRFQIENHRVNNISPGTSVVKKLSIGLRFSFGSSSLKNEEQNGSAMDIYRPNLPVLPHIVYSG